MKVNTAFKRLNMAEIGELKGVDCRAGGHVPWPKKALVQKFGRPDPGGDKATMEWTLRHENGARINIYDYKGAQWSVMASSDDMSAAKVAWFDLYREMESAVARVITSEDDRFFPYV